MSDDTGSSFGRFVVVALLVMGTLGFGLAGLCGGVFIVGAMPDLLSKGPQSYAVAMLVISLPSLLIGGALAWLCARKLLRMSRGRHEAAKE